MHRLGIISGDGNLPLYIGKCLVQKNFDITYILLNSIKNEKNYKHEKCVSIDTLSINKLINILNKNKINKIIFAGGIRRPSIKDIGFDFDTIKLAKKLLLEKRGDNGLLVSIKNYLENKGFIFFNWTKYCPELFAIEKNISKTYPSKYANNNLIKARSIYQEFKKTDVGQSIVVQNQMVLGLEP